MDKTVFILYIHSCRSISDRYGASGCAVLSIVPVERAYYPSEAAKILYLIIPVMRSEIINFPVDLLQKPYVEQFRIVLFDGDADAVGVDVIDQHIIGSAKDSQNILLFTFF